MRLFKTMLHRTLIGFWVTSLVIALMTASAPRVSATEADLKLEGGQDGTAFESMTIEGEDRVHIEFERPELRLSLDPLQVSGLEGEGMQAVIGRAEPDLVAPFLAASARERSPYLARPWFDELVTGTLVTFRPELEGVQRWSLLVADSKGDTVALFAGDKKPPKEIEWDGRTRSGEAALPGRVHSYVLTAWDKAGNKRSFVGDGFELPPYLMKTSRTETILFAGRHLEGESGKGTLGRADSPLLFEVASLLNQSETPDQTLELTVMARNYQQAKELADRVGASLSTRVLGDPARIRTMTLVETHAPEDGAVQIVADGRSGGK